MRGLKAAAVCVVLVAGWSASAQASTGAWRVHSRPPIPGATFLGGESCVAAGTCVFGGSVQTQQGTFRAVAARLVGDRWRAITTPPGSGIYGLSCTSPTTCEAMLSTGPARWNGNRWIAQPFSPGFLGSVSCATRTSCAAVGSTNSGRPLIERWDGKTWRRQQITLPRHRGSLFAVSCPSPTMCMAVGEANRPGSNGLHFSRSLGYQYDGTSWTSGHPPDPADAIFGQLTNIVCPSVNVCLAPSTYTNGGDLQQAFADVWQNDRWRITPLPLPSIAVTSVDSGINATDCLSRRDCIAVGSWQADVQSGPGAALFELWNGVSWRRQRGPLPLPGNGQPGSGRLTTLSCGSPTVCVGGGSYTTTTGATNVLVDEYASNG